MKILGVPFTKDEALKIISRPSFWSEVVFADGYRIAAAYPPPQVSAATYYVSVLREQPTLFSWCDSDQCTDSLHMVGESQQLAHDGSLPPTLIRVSLDEISAPAANPYMGQAA